MKKKRLFKPKQLLSKAAITSPSFTGGIGLSQEEQDVFLDFLIDESGLKDQVRIVRMTKETTKIDTLNLGNERPLVPGVAATDPGETVSINTTQITLQGKEMVAVTRISDDALEDNIEGEDFAEHVMRMVARGSANQIEDALIYGRLDASPTASDAGTNQLWDGWLKLAKAGGHVVDADGFGDRFISTEKFSALVKSLPNKYRKDKRNLRFTLADDIEQDYSDILAARGTGLGDRALLGEIPLSYRRIALNPFGLVRIDEPFLSGTGDTTMSAGEPAGETVIAVASETGFSVGEFIVVDFGGSKEETAKIASLSPLTIETGLKHTHAAATTVKEALVDSTDIILGDYRNLIWGIQREFTVETERQARLRATDWVVSMRMTANVENADALAVLEKLKVKP